MEAWLLVLHKGALYALLKFRLSCHPTRAEPNLPHSIVILLDVHSIHVASLKLIRDCLLSETNPRLFAIWAVMMNYITAIKSLNSTFGLPCYLRRENSAIPLICTRSFKLVCYLVGGNSVAIWQNSSFLANVHLISTSHNYSKQTLIHLKLATWMDIWIKQRFLLSGWMQWNNALSIEMLAFPCHNLIWTALWSGKRKAKSSSSYDGIFVCSLSPYCKFEINLRLYAIWLVTLK